MGKDQELVSDCSLCRRSIQHDLLPIKERILLDDDAGEEELLRKRRMDELFAHRDDIPLGREE